MAHLVLPNTQADPSQNQKSAIYPTLYVNSTILPCVVFATINPIAALGVFTKRLRRSE
jgi:hypothetical protein